MILKNNQPKAMDHQIQEMLKKRGLLMKNYVALYHNCAVRDAQICKLNQDTLQEPWENEYWQDLEDAEIFIGIFTAETELDATRQVMEQEGCDESAFKLIEVGRQNSSFISDDEDVVNAIREFCENYFGNEKAENLILDMGSKLLDVSVDTLLEMLDRPKR